MRDHFHENQHTELPHFGTVVLSSSRGVGISANLDAQTTLQISPYGVYAKPSEGDQMLLLPTANGTYVSLSVVDIADCPKTLQAGELLLKAKSGAYIWLKNNGQVEINGKIF